MAIRTAEINIGRSDPFRLSLLSFHLEFRFRISGYRFPWKIIRGMSFRCAIRIRKKTFVFFFLFRIFLLTLVVFQDTSTRPRTFSMRREPNLPNDPLNKIERNSQEAFVANARR